MREIKFRGKSEISHEWRYGSLVMIGKYPHIVEDCDVEEDGHHICQTSDRPTWIIPETLGQYTGLKDAEGKEIYEGDILFLEDDEVPFGCVSWHPDGYFAIDRHFGKYDFSKFKCRPLGEMLNRELDNGTVLRFVIGGNIHDEVTM